MEESGTNPWMMAITEMYDSKRGMARAPSASSISDFGAGKIKQTGSLPIQQQVSGGGNIYDQEATKRSDWLDKISTWIDNTLLTKNLDPYHFTELGKVRDYVRHAKKSILQQNFDAEAFDHIMQSYTAKNPNLFLGEELYSGEQRAYEPGETAAIRSFMPNFNFGDPMWIEPPGNELRKGLYRRL